MRFRFCACALNRQGIPTVCHARVPTVAHPGGNTWESSQLIVKYHFHRASGRRGQKTQVSDAWTSLFYFPTVARVSPSIFSPYARMIWGFT
jgi:hypothetical protein